LAVKAVGSIFRWQYMRLADSYTVLLKNTSVVVT